jgi:hypothetical protein
MHAFDKVYGGIPHGGASWLPCNSAACSSALPAAAVCRSGACARRNAFRSPSTSLNPHAFGRTDDFSKDLALQPQDLAVLVEILNNMECNQAADFRSGLIGESPRKLRRIHQYFSAVCGAAAYPRVRCNVFEYSAVIGSLGRVNPCFFISGPPEATVRDNLGEVLNSDSMMALRENLRSGTRAECARCVCSLWREPDHRGVSDFLPRERTDA